eukprot:4595794-Prymnesium_polylepis.3
MQLPQQGQPPPPPPQQLLQQQQQQPEQSLHPMDPLARWANGQIDVWQLHGLPNPETVCQSCARPRREHNADCDINGWRIHSYRLQQLPHDWPSLPGEH